MEYIYFPATKLKVNLADVLNAVYFKKNVVVVKRYGKKIAKIVPLEEDLKNKEGLESVLESYFGSLPDFPDVTKRRKFRRKILL